MGLLDRGVEIKTPDQIDLMRVAGLLTGQTLELLRDACRPGVTTGELDALAEDHIRSHGGVPSFQGYGHPPFPATICASVNEEVVHGIPGSRVLADGDVISIDCGAIVQGWHGDAAITVGDRRRPARGLRADAGHRGGLVGRDRGRAAGRARHRHLARRRDDGPGAAATTASSRTTSATASAPRCTCRRTCPTSAGPAVVRSWCRGSRSPWSRWSRSGTKETDVLADDWTVATADGSRAAHFEHTFTLTPDGAWVLTALDGGEARLAALGVPFGGR